MPAGTDPELLLPVVVFRRHGFPPHSRRDLRHANGRLATPPHGCSTSCCQRFYPYTVLCTTAGRAIP